MDFKHNPNNVKQENKQNFVFLVSKENEKIKVDRKITQMSIVINNAIDDINYEDVDFEAQEPNWPEIPCFNIEMKQLERVVQYCEKFKFNK